MSQHEPLPPVKDIVDFYARWPELRPRMEALTNGAPMTADDVIILQWLIKVADMIGPTDVGA